MQPTWLLITLVAVVFSVTGCSQYWGVRDTGVGTARGIATTAEYRLITERVRNLVGVSSAERRVICSEPSPDIAKAYSSALSVKVSEGSASGALAYQAAEAIAQLGKRYATIQLLRDVLYRDCEDYGNGAIDEIEYAFRMSRFGATVITLLGIEMVSGDTAPSPPAVSSPPLTLMNTGSGSVTVTPTGQTTTQDKNQAPDQSQSNDSGSKAAEALAVKIIAAYNAIQTAHAGFKDANDSIKQLPATPQPADQLAVAALRKAHDGLVAAGTAVDKAWAQVMKAGGKADATATGLIRDADKEILSAVAATNLAHSQVSTTAAATVKAADVAVGKAADQLTAAGKALDEVSDVLTAKPPAAAPKQTNTGSANPRVISDQQAKTIEAMQRQYLKDASLIPIAVACASVLNKLRFDTNSQKANPQDGKTGLSEFCLKYKFTGKVLEVDTSKGAMPEVFNRLLNVPR